MRRAISLLSALIAGIVLAGCAAAEVSIMVDKTTQRMTVSVNGQPRYSWPVSTGTAERHADRHLHAVTAGQGALLTGMEQCAHTALNLLHRCRPCHPWQPCHAPTRDPSLAWLRAADAQAREHPV